MAILGSIIKAAIDLRGAIVSENSPTESQTEVLKKLLETAKDTAFGKYYGFAKILEAEDIQKIFAEKVPYFDYHEMETEWWSKTQEGLEDITWPGCPKYFARSSGTTGKTSKKIPVTDDMIEAIRTSGIKQVGALTNFDIASEFYDKEIMMLGSSTNLEAQNQFLEGEISGISASNIPFWFRGFYKPGEEIALMEDWDEKVETICKRAKDWDIGALSGIPSWMELMMKKVMEYHGAKNIHEVWPNLKVYTTGGVAFQPYEKSFNQLLAHPIIVIDTYLASEGFLAFQNRPDTTSMKLVTDNGIYFEFVPFKPEYINEDGSLSQDAPALTLAEVETDTDYVLIISTVSGAWRYLIGDTIAFTDVEKAEIKITGRTKFFLNVVGSQLSVNKMEVALREMEDKFDIKIPEFTLAAVKINDEFHHHWYLGTETDINSEEIAQALDEALKEANKNYEVARSKALKGVKVTTVSTEVFQEWNAKNKKKGGQVKMEKVMGEEKFADWEAFVKAETSK
ncbi:GH3 auxin-responsive promoter-binding protein [Aequorivita sublithincola DSM 14238]|uniref:GH3 auxin-responsive promoter-binding protein n=1 Tax=Aequorivita sublithincola (strain DSM 14238 / LMG 21431 / ACAM 643 / 9-3) TaxID=746697 RepID=I3YRH5_AEQSU|nr:GH3 auxin-responsive promoter family protein [Aequorivita sublithincola]AFL79593.1 GH3 auxin-responsive promoter-binding protein [Aequorivita sublithincola DSM 14238]